MNTKAKRASDVIAAVIPKKRVWINVFHSRPRIVVEAEANAANLSWRCVGTNVHLGEIDVAAVDNGTVRQVRISGDGLIRPGVDQGKAGDGLRGTVGV